MDKVEIDSETADRIVVCSLKESIRYAKEYIAKYKKKKRLSHWEQEELVDLVTNLEHLQAVYKYYGGNLQ